MEILKRGTKHLQEKVYVGTCDSCDSIIKYEKDEVQGTLIFENKEPGVESKEHCPVCKEDVISVKLEKHKFICGCGNCHAVVCLETQDLINKRDCTVCGKQLIVHNLRPEPTPPPPLLLRKENRCRVEDYNGKGK